MLWNIQFLICFPNPVHILDVEGGENEKFQISNTNSTPTLIFPHIKPKNNDVFAKSG